MSENEITNQNGEQNNDNRNIVVLGILLSIFFYCVPALIIYFAFGKERLSPVAYKSIVNLLNFEIYVALIFIAATVLSPVLFLLTVFVFPALWIFNLIICIQAFQAYDAKREYTYPLNTSFIK